MDDLARRGFLPSRATPLHPYSDETLTGGLRRSTADGQPTPARTGIPESVPMILEIGDRVMHRAIVANRDVAARRRVQRGEDVIRGSGAVQQRRLPAGHHPGGVVAVDDVRGRCELFHEM